MGRALYRKHRPKSLAEVIGQEHITDTLSNALKQDMISHAYLLTGPRGTGKTSIARILAYEVNDLPYDEDGTHMDIIEIDAASNRRIDEIRELKERVNIAPTSAKFKVYIIDEVHMLTKEAFNALLKTLEEPPAHVIFILATTEAHKVPETIVSRTQRLTFKPIDLKKVVNHLKTIAKNENITITDDALMIVAEHGEGSFRDSISLLDQIRHTNERIGVADIQQAIGLAPDKLITNLLKAIQSGEIQQIASSMAALRSHGAQSAQIAKQLITVARQDVIQQSILMPLEQTLSLLEDLLQVSASNDSALALELALYKSVLANPARKLKPVTPPSPVPPSEPIISNDRKTQPSEAKPAPKEVNLPAQNTKQNTNTSPVNISETIISESTKGKALGALDESSWLDILAVVKSKHNTLYGIARMGVPHFESNKLTLDFVFPFHQKRLSDAKNKKLLLDIITQVTGLNITLECMLVTPADKPPKQKNTGAKPTDTLNLETISNIFGGAEIVE